MPLAAQAAKANGVEGAHRLRSRSRMVVSTPFRIGASQRSIVFAATSAAPAPYHGLGTAAFSTTASSAAALIETLGGLLQPPPQLSITAQGRSIVFAATPALQQPCARNALGGPLWRNRSRMPYSKCSAAFSSCSMMSMLCGHIASHAPHWMQSLARPGAACQLYCCLANSVFSV